MGYDAGYIDGFFHDAAGNVKKSTTLPIVGEVCKASHPMIQYVGRVSFAKNPDVASFNYPGTTIEASFQGSSLKMLCCPEDWIFHGAD